MENQLIMALPNSVNDNPPGKTPNPWLVFGSVFPKKTEPNVFEVLPNKKKNIWKIWTHHPEAANTGSALHCVSSFRATFYPLLFAPETDTSNGSCGQSEVLAEGWGRAEWGQSTIPRAHFLQTSIHSSCSGTIQFYFWDGTACRNGMKWNSSEKSLKRLCNWTYWK